MSDESRILNEVSDATDIYDGTARAIAAMYHDGSQAAVEFVSTGAVPAGQELEELFTVFRPQNNRAIDLLLTYLLDHGGRRKVPGWESLWIGDSI